MFLVEIEAVCRVTFLAHATTVVDQNSLAKIQFNYRCKRGSLVLIAVYKNTRYTSVLNHLNDFKIE